MFSTIAHFPNCLTAIDGKHIHIQKPYCTGSEFMNYKHFFFLAFLMFVTDADYCYTSINIGSYGSAIDLHVFQKTNFG